MARSTKIVATLGPASSDPLVLERMLTAGVDVVRFNFSHGTAEDHLERARLVRETSAKIGIDVAIMADLQGPKVRVGKFEGGRVTLKPGARFVLDARTNSATPNARASITRTCQGREAGDTLLLNDGLIVARRGARDAGRDPHHRPHRRRNCRTTRASTSRAAACPRPP